MTKPKYTQADIDAVMDNPELTAEDIAQAVPFAQAFPELAATMRGRGRPAGSTKADAKKNITLRLDPDVIEGWRASGPGWQVRMNEALRKAMPH